MHLKYDTNGSYGIRYLNHMPDGTNHGRVGSNLMTEAGTAKSCSCLHLSNLSRDLATLPL